MATLIDAKAGDVVTVKKLHGEVEARRKIMDLGITRGVPLVVRDSESSDFVEVTVRGFDLSISAADAETIEVE